MTDNARPTAGAALSAEAVQTERFMLAPLTVAHAEEMAAILADPALYHFTGGEPPSIRELVERYERQVAGAPAGGVETWLNWIIATPSGDAVGYVQATVTTPAPPDGGPAVAEIAWVVAAGRQGQGVATVAAAAMASWLRAKGVERFVADIHPDHVASQTVARRLGLSLTDAWIDGEQRWAGRLV